MESPQDVVEVKEQVELDANYLHKVRVENLITHCANEAKHYENWNYVDNERHNRDQSVYLGWSFHVSIVVNDQLLDLRSHWRAYLLIYELLLAIEFNFFNNFVRVGNQASQKDSKAASWYVKQIEDQIPELVVCVGA